MNQGDLFKKIGNILSELQDQYQYLAENPEKLNELELELFLSNANFLTDHIHIVIKANSYPSVKAITEHAAPALLNEEVFRPDPEPAAFEFRVNAYKKDDKFDFEEKGVGEIFDRPLSEEEQQIIAQKQKLKVKQETKATDHGDEVGPEPFLISPQDQTKEEHFVEPPSSLAEQVLQTDLIEEAVVVEPVFVAESAIVEHDIPEAPLKPTLNERLGNSLGTNINGESSKAGITDLKQGISLNDKLLYIKDLFHGYSLAYAEVIDLLNKMPDFETAETFLQKNYALKNGWTEKQATVDRFYELLHQRFPAK